VEFARLLIALLCARMPARSARPIPRVARLTPLRLRPRELHVLRHLDAAGALSQTELAAGIGVERGQPDRDTGRARGEALIRRQIDPRDRGRLDLYRNTKRR
jgi:DNA-binding MarR family transcriptional regulator